ATDELVDRVGEKSIASLKEVIQNHNTDPAQLIQALWALYRLDALPKKAHENALNHDDVGVKVHAYRILAEYTELDEVQLSWGINGLNDMNPHVQRAAAELLSRHPNPKSYKPLIALYHRVPDY